MGIGIGGDAMMRQQQQQQLSKQSHVITGPAKFAVFTWHGCTIDIDVEFGKHLGGSYCYTSKETDCNVAYVNTHAQLEAMRDEALGSYLDPNSGNHRRGSGGGGAGTSNGSSGNNTTCEPPRVLVVGPGDTGKTSLVKVLTSYAVKLGRNPLLVDLDVSQNLLSIPGTITASPMTPETISPKSNASSSSLLPNTTPLAFWYGSTELSTNPDLYKSFLDKMGQCINDRLSNDSNNNSKNNSNNAANPQDNPSMEKASGIIVNGFGWIEEVGYELILHAIQSLKINVVLVMGHDKLYTLLNSHYAKLKEQMQRSNSLGEEDEKKAMPKVIKLPRSGGIVTRDSNYRRVSCMQSIKQYFYGESIVPSSMYSNASSLNPGVDRGGGGGLGGTNSSGGAGGNSSGLSVATSSLAHQYSPSLLQFNFSEITIYKIDYLSLSASMLPVSAKQTSDAVQLTEIEDIGISIQHSMLAVCHPVAVENYKQSGEARDLYLTGVTGFVVVEKVDVNQEMISLLSPCSGALASYTLLAADITWRE